MKKCLVCETEFEPKNPKGKFCSDACKMKAARNKKKLVFAKPVERLKPEGLFESKIEFAKTTSESYDAPKIKKPNDEPPKVSRTMSKYDLERRMKKNGF